MTTRVFNFGAGPAVLPESVLEQAQADLLALPGVGMSVLEISHRSGAFDEIIDRARVNIRTLAGVADDYHILFTQGGATQQFAMVPLNLLPEGRSADYTLTGSWAKKAFQEAQRFGTARVAASGAEGGFVRIPSSDEIDVSTESAYLHVTSNNTIVGTQWKTLPRAGGVPLVVDASSDVLSRPLDLAGDGVGLLYAGAQKNLGPAGVTVVIVRSDLVDRVSSVSRTIPTMLRYDTYVESESLYNTPPVFAIYIVSLVTDWLIANGGLEAMASRNRRKAERLYAAIDGTEFYRGTADPDSRSLMNVTFRLPSEDLETRFVAQARKEGMDGLKGHRSVGGIRASIYNAFPEAGIEALTAFMAEFERVNG